MARQMTRSELVRSWAFFVLGFGLFVASELLHGQFAELGQLADLGVWAMVFWRAFGKPPEPTPLQFVLGLGLVIFLLGDLCRRLWDSPLVIPLMPVFAFLCLLGFYIVVNQMVEMGRWMSSRFGKRVTD